MIKIDGTSITMTRGDTLKLKLNLATSSGAPYTPNDGDKITFGLKKSCKDDKCLIIKDIPTDTMILHIEPKDTKSLSFGVYVWDCQIEFSNGDVSTFIPKASFKIAEEVV